MNHRILSFFVLSSLVILVSCGEQQGGQRETTPSWQAEAETVSQEQAIQSIPNFSLPSSSEHLQSSRKEERNAVVIKALYRFSGDMANATDTFTSSNLKTISKNDREALYQRLEKTKHGGRNQLQVKIESYNPASKLHFGTKNIQSTLDTELRKGDRLIQIIYRRRR